MEPKVKDEKVNVELTGTQILHVRDDSESELQALFDCVLKPSSQMPLQIPFKMRDLPASFFTPPSHRQSPRPPVSHSREGSSDSTYGESGNGSTSLRVGGTVSPPQIGPTIQHFRHHSSPASLQQTLSVAPQQHVHTKQHSYDALADDLPPGWEQARTPGGQIYYLNHVTQTTTWEDPRKSTQSFLLQNATSQTQSSGKQTSSVSASPVPNHQPASPASSLNVTPPPPHVLKSTQTSTSSSSNTSSMSVASALSGIPIGLVNSSITLPEHWEQAVTPEGEIYFINHSEKITTWFDPRIPRHLQTHIALKSAHALAALEPPQLQNSQQSQQQNVNMRLRLERARQRQQEITRLQEQASHGNRSSVQQRSVQDQSPMVTASPPVNISSQQSSPAVSRAQVSAALSGIVNNISSVGLTSVPLTLPATQVTTVSTTGDPFMTTTDFHTRQESADSGLGLGSNYTHPHTPEDFLNVDDVDLSSSDELRPSASSPMLETTELEPMDSEDLIPSISVSDAEFLNDVLGPSRMENLSTWL